MLGLLKNCERFISSRARLVLALNNLITSGTIVCPILNAAAANSLVTLGSKSSL